MVVFGVYAFVNIIIMAKIERKYENSWKKGKFNSDRVWHFLWSLWYLPPFFKHSGASREGIRRSPTTPWGYVTMIMLFCNTRLCYSPMGNLYGESSKVCINASISNSFPASQNWNSRCSSWMYGASSDTKTSANSFAVFPQTSRVPRKSDFFENNWKYLSIPFSSGADL